MCLSSRNQLITTFIFQGHSLVIRKDGTTTTLGGWSPYCSKQWHGTHIAGITDPGFKGHRRREKGCFKDSLLTLSRVLKYVQSRLTVVTVTLSKLPLSSALWLLPNRLNHQHCIFYSDMSCQNWYIAIRCQMAVQNDTSLGQGGIIYVLPIQGAFDQE